MSEEFALDTKYYTQPGIICDNSIAIWGYAVDTDALNDVSIEVWDSKQEKLIYPRIVWSATDKYKQPVMTKARYSKNGLKLVAKTKGWFRFIPFYQNSR